MKKRDLADIEASNFYELQKKFGNGKTRKTTAVFTLSTVFITSMCIGILIWTLPKKEFSENENRILTVAPEISGDSVANGQLAREISDFFSDHFPLRDFFVELHSNSELLLQGESNGVIKGKNGVLAIRPENLKKHLNNLKRTTNVINKFAEDFENMGLYSVSAIAPFPTEAQKSSMPRLWSNAHLPDVTENIKSAVSLADVLKDKENVWYKTDHHWTSYGAYLAYVKLGEALGYTPYAPRDFSINTVSDTFYGTVYSRSGLYSTKPDTVELWRYAGDEKFYDMSYLDKKDKYAVFGGGNHGHLTYDSDEEKPRLLIIKDSYANAVIPFIARHFSLEVVDPRYFYGDIYEIAAKCDKVLFLYGAASLLIDTDLIRLTLK